MPLQTKAILINCAIVVGLVYQYWIGKPLVAVVIAGVLLFVVANAGLMFAAKKQSSKNQ